ncbi:MAG: FmdB family zinc ribbon protein [Acidimicrobiales bacterium]
MPTYEYACKQCGEQLEVVQAFTDDSLTVCPNCGGDLRKVFGSVGIVFKGSGFYKTDSRSASKSSNKSEAASVGESSNGDSSSTAPAKADKTEKAEKSETSAKSDKAESKPSSTATESKPAAAAS